MRILYMGLGDTLIGRHLPQSWPDRLFGPKVGRHEVKTFGYAEDLDIQVAHDASFADVLAQLPPEWVPDVCVCTHVDFLVIPPGIEDAPFPTVAITADWDFRVGIARTMAEAFDLTIALSDDSCAAMRLLGARTTAPFAYFGVPEELLAGELEDIDRHRPIDVLFTGTIQDGTHLDRSQWLHRLAQLSSKYRIHVAEASAAQGSYHELLKRAKLVFTFHRRGEIQLRFTDAVTQGALVLDNGVQTAVHFDPEREYLHYDEQNFEALIERHLEDGALRRKKVEAARTKIAEQFGSVHRFELLFDQLEPLLGTTSFGARPAQSLPATEKARRTAEQHYANHFDCSMGPSDRYLPIALEALEHCEPGCRRQNDAAVIRYSLACHGSGQTANTLHDALRGFEDLVASSPDYTMAWFNTGYANWSDGDRRRAHVCFVKAYEMAQSPDVAFDAWALHNHEQHLGPQSFKKAYNDALLALIESGDERPVRHLIAATCAYYLSLYHHEEGRLLDAHQAIDSACKLDPKRGEFAKQAARSADILGKREDANQFYQKSVALLPMDFGNLLAAIDFHTRNGDLAIAKSLLHQSVQLIKSVKGSEHLKHELHFLAAAMSHIHLGTPVMQDLVSDRFANGAMAQLLTRGTDHLDPSVEARVHELLMMQGKTQAAADWRDRTARLHAGNAPTPRIPNATTSSLETPIPVATC